MEIKPKKQLIVLIDEDIFVEIKLRAIHKNVTRKKWVLQAILEKIAQEDKYK